MEQEEVYPATVFYDGACPLCAAEMARYRRAGHGGRLRFVDISAAGFDPASYGLSLDDFMAQMHVRDAAGRWHRGVDAFPVLWGALPGYGYRLLCAILALPGVHGAARVGYRLFARLRRHLPGRR